MSDRINKKYIADCIRKAYPGLRNAKMKFGTSQIYIFKKMVYVNAVSVRGKIKRTNFLLELENKEFDPKRLYKRVVYNHRNGRIW